MFDWWKNRNKETEPSNVVKFPEPKETPKMPYVVPPAPPKEESGKVYYRLGLTDNDRVAFSMGMTEITMNRQGCQNMIDQLTFFMNQIPEDEND